MIRSALLAATAATLTAAAPAAASTVTVTLDARFHDFNQVLYTAAPGETNRLDAHYAADARSVTVTDPGAVITAQGSCTSVNAHKAVCTAPNPPFPVAGPFVQSVRAVLGDGDDRAVTSRTGPNVIGGLEAFGGPGRDRLVGSPTEDLLDGGPGPDVLTGGDGTDTLSYAGRTAGVRVDLATGKGGEPGEGDTFNGFENVRGGAGDDRLAGDGQDNSLDGGGGSNRLIGRGGDDALRHATGRAARCGAGRDFVTGTRAHTRLRADCETLAIPPTKGAVVDSPASIAPTPQRRHGALGFAVSCPDLDGETEDCSAKLRIRAGHRLLAAGRLGSRGTAERFLRVHRTAPAGHRRRATVTIRGALMRRTRWTIMF